MEFPQYRKLSGFGRYYKITGERNFTEVYYIGVQRIVNHVAATQFPEMLRIGDMLQQRFDFTEMNAEEISKHFGEEVSGC